jgi:hypothetical protein
MRKTLLIGAAIAALAVAAPALAGNAHFIGTPSITQNGDTLTVSFKAAGLGNVESATFNLDGSVTVSSRCYTRKGNTPQAANKQETIPVSASDTFPVSNGQTTGSLTVTASSTLDCPGGQHVVIESFTYDLTLSGEGLEYHFVS